MIDPEYSKVKYLEKGGQLTALGHRQMYLLGREMSRRYIDDKQLISKVPDSKQFYAFSIDEDAALVSAQAFMSGFYPSGL